MWGLCWTTSRRSGAPWPKKTSSACPATKPAQEVFHQRMAFYCARIDSFRKNIKKIRWSMRWFTCTITVGSKWIGPTANITPVAKYVLQVWVATADGLAKSEEDSTHSQSNIRHALNVELYYRSSRTRHALMKGVLKEPLLAFSKAVLQIHDHMMRYIDI